MKKKIVFLKSIVECVYCGSIDTHATSDPVPGRLDEYHYQDMECEECGAGWRVCIKYGDKKALA